MTVLAYLFNTALMICINSSLIKILFVEYFVEYKDHLMTVVTRPTPRRPSWRGILAGLLMGIIVAMAMTALALILGSFLSLDLQGAGITAGIYATLTALLSAFVAGHFAVKASAPEVLFGDGTDINPKDATLTGILTAATIIVVTSYLTMSGATNLIRGAGNVAGSVASGTATAVTGTAGAITGVAASGGAGLAGLASQTQLGEEAKRTYDQVTGNIERKDIEQVVAKNLEGIDQAQVSATSAVIEEMFKEVSQDIRQDIKGLDLTNLDTWKNLDVLAKDHMARIEQMITGNEFVQRLQAQGLTEEQAIQVRNEIQTTYTEYKAQTEAKINETRAKLEQGVEDAKQAARKAAMYAGLLWLISAALTFIASIFGARSAAAKYRIVR